MTGKELLLLTKVLREVLQSLMGSLRSWCRSHSYQKVLDLSNANRAVVLVQKAIK